MILVHDNPVAVEPLWSVFDPFLSQNVSSSVVEPVATAPALDFTSWSPEYLQVTNYAYVDEIRVAFCDFTIEFFPEIAAGEVFTTVEIIADSSDIQIHNTESEEVALGQRIMATILGWDEGETYTFTFKGTTDGGAILVQKGILQVQ